MQKELITFLNKENIPFLCDVDLKKKTWIKRGGLCKYYIIPDNTSQLIILGRYLYASKIDFLVVGHTSNLYITNEYNIDVVISTLKCNNFVINSDTIVCDAGVGVSQLSRKMVAQGISGFEYLLDLPGTVAAALYNNSSCHKNSISSLLIGARILTQSGKILTFKKSDFEFTFRDSILKSGKLKGIILDLVLEKRKGDPLQLKEIAEQNHLQRSLYLEGNARNLGCTVNRCFINGTMPLKYKIPYRIYGHILKFSPLDIAKRREKLKEFLCFIAGYNSISKYISNKNPIIFMWLDSDADAAFPLYLEFMKKVYKTDKMEIEYLK